MADSSSDVAMSLYWDCQSLQAQLGEAVEDRKFVIIDSIKKCEEKYRQHSHLMEFSPKWSWFNVSKSLSMENLKGMITVVDFFTYCCINCMHILPLLEELEELFPEHLAVIGVHSAKFENERGNEQVEHAIKRYKIEHAVCNDVELALWTRLGITCWPTLLILSPTGIPIHVFMGEGHGDFLKEFLSVAMEHYKDSLINQTLPLDLNKKVDNSPATLHYPGKVEYTPDNKLLVSDSGKHRILLLGPVSQLDSSTWEILDVVGSGAAGSADGDFLSASFRNPQGLCWISDGQYLVADTDNHLLRLVDTKSRKVSTVGGTGRQGNDKEGGRQGGEQEISSPWDVCRVGEGIAAVAMAGIHQIWLYCMTDTTWWKGAKFSAGTLVRIAGSGAEENRNNSYPAKAGFAQPSGLAFSSESGSSGWLFIADSESSTVRRLDLKDGSVKNVCGGERDPTNLFAFGDREGAGVEARLQHPLAVAWNKETGQLYVADSYNHKIKMVSGPKNNTETLCGNGQPGNDVGNAQQVRLSEPGGLAISTDCTKLFIADTNNHKLKVMDLSSLMVQNVNIIAKTSNATAKVDFSHSLEVGKDGKVLLRASLAHPDKQLNAEAPSMWTIRCMKDGDGTNLVEMASGKLDAGCPAWSWSCSGLQASSRLQLTFRLYTCSTRETGGVCTANQQVHAIQLVPASSSDCQEPTLLDLGSVL